MCLFFIYFYGYIVWKYVFSVVSEIKKKVDVAKAFDSEKTRD